LVSTNFINDPFKSFCEDQYAPDGRKLLFPCKAIEVMQSDPEYRDLKLFNNFGWGGFLIWTWPEKQLFIDGRMPQADYAEKSLLEEYLEFTKEGQSAAYLDKHQIDMVLFYDDARPIKLNWIEKNLFFMNETEINKKKSWLKEYLNNSPNWKLIYVDNIAKVYVRQNK
jgi:hypothetical protein